ncbi:MAG: hypothetical protein LBI66_01960 [Burkholderiaceae bacterium]|jgi:hypothetical protein|nr:hypothetical protein [Burkholderiaceae bacterium]
MDVKTIACALVAACTLYAPVPSPAQTTTYTLSAGNYRHLLDFTECPSGTCRNFTAAMKPGGSIAFSAPVTQDNKHRIRSLLESFDFHDGVESFSHGDARVHVSDIQAFFQPDGQWGGMRIVLLKWLTGTVPHGAHPLNSSQADRFTLLDLGGPYAFAARNYWCAELEPGAEKACRSWQGGSVDGADGFSSALAPHQGLWTVSVAPVVAPAPAPDATPVARQPRQAGRESPCRN